jgi:hypothetical protein
MAKTHLTAAGVLRLKPAAVRREVPDAGAVGLRLVIQPSGAKSWALRFRRPGGRLAKLTLGPLDSAGNETPHQPVIGFPLTLVAARALAAEVHRQRAQDLDVVEQHLPSAKPAASPVSSTSRSQKILARNITNSLIRNVASCASGWASHTQSGCKSASATKFWIHSLARWRCANHCRATLQLG